MSSTANELSEKLLLAVKMEEDTRTWEQSLAVISLAQLQTELMEDTHKKAFWINVYNAFFQILRKVQQVDKKGIYTVKYFTIAQQQFSLDDVEHGILRKYRYKFSLGYLPNFFAPLRIRRLAVDSIDYRIHFALNCGAKSCPPIAFYTTKGIEQQLEMATLSFLEGETKVDENEKTVHVTRLFRWYLGDFGGKRGIRRVLQKYLNLTTTGYRLIYQDYSWDEDLNNYSGNWDM